MHGAYPLTLADAAARIRSRELSPVDLVTEALRRIRAYDPAIHAFITVTADAAMAQARQAEKEISQGRYRGALHGIPYALKDNYLTAGILTTGHSRRYEHEVPAVNAAAVDKLADAGAILLGKNSMHELAHGGPSFDLPWPPARNPWNLAHFTAGSSSGSAAAVAAGMAWGALGTDTGGSVVNPAALCGLVGIKPTFGLVSRRGVIPNCFSLDHCGVFARTVEDTAILLQAIAGHDPQDRTSIAAPAPDLLAGLRADLRGVRVGVVRAFGNEAATSPGDLHQATEDALDLMVQLGARLHDVRLRPLQAYYDVWTLIEAPETFDIQRQALTDHPEIFGSVFLTRTLIACLIHAADYMAAQRERTLIIGEMQALMEDCDVLVCAGAGPAPVLEPGLARWPTPNRTVPFTLTGFPMMSVPTGFTRTGLPLSVQLVGRPRQDAMLLGVAHAYERASGWTRHQAPAPSHVPAPVRGGLPMPTTEAAAPDILRLCTQAARQAGLQLPEKPLALLCEAAPALLEMIARVRGARSHGIEPANLFIA